ncbi:MAG: hypothetical protein Q4D80_06165, partial [Pseudomonadota bacterium]|nr:hypothetical protein [Pseudomonadota bacterium]
QNTNNQGGKPTGNNNGGNNQGSNHQNTNNQGDNNGGIKGRMVNMKTTVVNYTRPTAHSLTVGNAFKAIRHPQQAYRTVKRLAQQGQQDWQNADGVKDKGKLILKKSGQVVLRSVRGNVVEAASGTTKVMGGFLNFLGDAMEKAPQKWQNERQQNQQNQEYEDNQQRRQQEREAEWGMDNAERY